MISPQGYLLGKDPKAKNPFWNQGEAQDVERIFATATVDDNVGTPQVQTTKSISGHDITFGFNFKNLKGRPGEPGTPGADGYSPTASVRSVANGSEITITDKNGTTRSVVQNGQPGTPGVSPTANVVPTSNGARITITDANGTTEADIENGTPGTNGENGISPTVAITDITGGHRVTVTDANGSRSFDVMDGTPGTNGNDGISPTARVEQIQGQNAAKIVVTDAQGTTEATLTGEAGTPGVSPTIAITDITGGHRITITDANGSRSFDVMDGTPGTNGEDGISPTVAITDITGGHRVTVTDANGSRSFDVMDGTPGTPGTPGQNGITPVISASATVDGTSGTPSVNVTKGGTDAAPSFAFAFSGLKGESGQGGGGDTIINVDIPNLTFFAKAITVSITPSDTKKVSCSVIQLSTTNEGLTQLVRDIQNAEVKSLWLPVFETYVRENNSRTHTYVQCAVGMFDIYSAAAKSPCIILPFNAQDGARITWNEGTLQDIYKIKYTKF